MIENSVLKKIFGLKREKVKRDRRKLRNDEIRDLYSSSNIIPVMKQKYDMDVTSGTYGGHKKFIQAFLWGNLRKTTTWKP
jgi:hypothetical protein